MEIIDVSVVIVNYNTLKMTNDCIESILEFTKENTIEIIVVDNASTDGSKDFYADDNRVKYIYSDVNLGFGNANNLGVKNANGKYVFLLNSDTLLLNDVINKLFEFSEFNLNNNIGAVGTCLINKDGEDALSFGEFLSAKRIYERLSENIGIRKKNFVKEVYSKIEKDGFSTVGFVSGADLFIRRTVFNEISGFDSDFFMYFEETDLEKRLEEKGYENYIINARDIIHLEGGSFGHSLPFNRKMLMTKGLNLYIRKHYSGQKKAHIKILSFFILLKDLRNLNYTFKENVSLIRTIFKMQ